ncbi:MULTISPECIES: hypothetical protein [unclassified Saccharibacter]|uniref:hypothetical protein n=1 Tax=unclassified Saccharibacter TaxID=2648722 RepID=UPI00132B1C1D|nr:MULTISPECIES: hypothetical protein [unclassified Saccharibacter]MXV35977.1 hypothetical protein [Saccharibacter sp. EH611]MXV58413.1 hypothetical protein [Saccharibacter sp. EH70]MXV65916.1 hypothetical protein [Saccharibacter sp. EH60]
MTTTEDNKRDELKIWLLETQHSSAEEAYKEVMSAHERLKGRLSSALTLTITLCTAFYTAAFSGTHHALACLLIGIGYTAVAFVCIAGLYPTALRTKAVNAEAFNAIMEIDPTPLTKEDHIKRFTQFIEATVFFNTQKLCKDRLLLQTTWVLLVLIPPIASVMAWLF